MDLQQLLKEIGPGHITCDAYNTAWIARLNRIGEPMGERAMEWLRSHQLADGSWGAGELRYHHDRAACTLAAMTALAGHGHAKDRKRWQRAQLALETHLKGLMADPAGATIGFEMIVPSLIKEAESLNIQLRQNSELLDRLTRYRAAKLARLPKGVINRYVTVAFSAEMIGSDGVHLLDVENLQESNGSVAYSPAATVFFALNVRQDPAALQYLRQVAVDGTAPYTAPIDVFEQAWVLRNLAMIGPLDDETLKLCQPHLDFLQATWQPGKGIAAVSGLTLVDGDTSAMVHEVLTCYGRSPDLEGVLYYEELDHFRCFGLEANPSISTNVHVLGALRRAGLGRQHPLVKKALDFLRRAQTLGLFWFDKWHASPYYTTAHAVIACAGYENELVDDAIYWILATQGEDGSWGYYMPTAEETAYCLQALVAWKRCGGQVPGEVIRRGAKWLEARAQLPYPSLWIGKSLYCPTHVVHSAVLSALVLAAQE